MPSGPSCRAGRQESVRREGCPVKDPPRVRLAQRLFRAGDKVRFDSFRNSHRNQLPAAEDSQDQRKTAAVVCCPWLILAVCALYTVFGKPVSALSATVRKSVFLFTRRQPGTVNQEPGTAVRLGRAGRSGRADGARWPCGSERLSAWSAAVRAPARSLGPARAVVALGAPALAM
jgi:hypothetical protein